MLRYDGVSIWVQPGAIVTGAMVENVSSDVDAVSGPAIEFHLTDKGKAHFAAATRANVGRTIAIILNGAILATPRILQPIEGGGGEIICSCTAETVQEMSRAIQADKDALPLKVIDYSVAR